MIFQSIKIFEKFIKGLCKVSRRMRGILAQSEYNMHSPWFLIRSHLRPLLEEDSISHVPLIKQVGRTLRGIEGANLICLAD